MLKKLATLLISTTLTLTLLGFSKADAATSNDDLKTLIGLGIVTDTLPSKVTNEVFYKSLAGFFYDDIAGMSAESLARGINAIASTEQFNAKAKITVGDALKSSATALGYDKVTENPTDEFLISKAAELGLAKGLVGKYNEELTSEDMIVIFTGLLEAEPIVMNFVSANPSYSIAKDETLLSINRDIYHYKGYVTATVLTSLYSEKGLTEGYIELDNVQFSADEYDNDLIGKYVQAYIQKDDEDVVLYVAEYTSRNEILIIDAEDIDDVSDDMTQIKYYTENEKLKTAKIDTRPAVLYNGIFFGSYTKTDFWPEQGKVELIDNDSDSEYDVIKITSYQTIIVNSIDLSNKIIYNKYTYTERLDSLDVEELMKDKRLNILRNGEKINFADISAGDVLNVALSKGTANALCTIYASSEKVAIEINSIDSEWGEIETDEGIYKISASLEDELASQNQSISLSKKYSFYIDSFGEIAYLETIMSNEYCVYRRAYYDEMDGVQIQYMDMNGKWKTARLADRIRIDDASVRDDVAYENYLKYYEPQLVMLNENSKGEVNRITFATETDRYMEGVFRRTPSKSMVWRSSSKHFDNVIYAEDTARMVVLPDDPEASKEEYRIADVSLLRGDVAYTFQAYDTDVFGFTQLITVKNSQINTNSETIELFLVTGTKYYMNSDNEVVLRIKGCVDGYRDIEFSLADESLADNVLVGDVVALKMNMLGEVITISPRYRLSEQLTYNGEGDRYNGGTLVGKITDIDVGKGRMRVNFGTRYLTIKFSPEMGIVVYDKGNRTGELSAASSLTLGDEIITRWRYMSCTTIVKVQETR